MKHKKDFYEILGIDKNATNEEIRKNYKKVLKKTIFLFKNYVFI